MKKLLILLIVSVIVMATSIPAFAQAVMPDQSVGNVSISAHDGLHRAHHNLMGKNEYASDVFHNRIMPAFPHRH